MTGSSSVSLVKSDMISQIHVPSSEHITCKGPMEGSGWHIRAKTEINTKGVTRKVDRCEEQGLDMRLMCDLYSTNGPWRASHVLDSVDPMYLG